MILRNVNNPKVLFATTDKVLSASINVFFSTPFKDLCERFLKFFIGMIDTIQSNILPLGNVVVRAITGVCPPDNNLLLSANY